MAETILSVIAKVVLEKISSLFLSETSLAWGIKKELRKLEMTLSTIRAVILDAEEQQAKNHAARDWLEKLKDVVYDVDDVLDELSTEALRRKVKVHGSMLKEMMLKDKNERRLRCRSLSSFSEICPSFPPCR